jgi:hypothetical protein
MRQADMTVFSLTDVTRFGRHRIDILE